MFPLSDPNTFLELLFSQAQGYLVHQSLVHQELQDFLTAHSHALVELPRDHGKSTQICARIVWELARDPSLRVKIVCATEALATERGRFIRTTIEQNSHLQYLVPELDSERPWNDTRFTIVRPADVIGPSVMAVGVGSGSTGARADLLICDDIVDVKAIVSRSERERVKKHFRDNLMNLLEPDGRFWGLCTPWHRDDLNAELKRNDRFHVFRRCVNEQLEPVWPERWPREALLERRAAIGSLSFARGYRLQAMSEEAVALKPEWVQFWTDAPQQYDRIVLSIDPALSTKPSADRSALVVLGRHENHVDCLATHARRVATPDLVNLIATIDAQWNPDVILFEANAAFKGIAELLTQRARFGPKVKTTQQTRDKASRVASFSVAVENGTFRLQGSAGNVVPEQQELFDEMTTFPLHEHDDLLDATATGTAYLLDVRDPRSW